MTFGYNFKKTGVLDCSIDALLASDYETHKISENKIAEEIINYKELKSLFKEIKGMDTNDINFYKRLIEFIEEVY